MSYRLIDSNEIAIKYSEVNEMDCIYVDLPNGLDNEYHYIEAEPKHAYVIVDEDGNMECSNCGSSNCFDNYCGNCGAKLVGTRKDDGENG